MARVLDKEKALKLRAQGWSYSQIKKEIGVSKSTLSGWLAAFPLSVERMKELRDNSEIRIEKCRQTKRQKKLFKLDITYWEAEQNVGALTQREIFLAGLFLYWGEGGKTGNAVSLSNTDPDVMKFFLKWIIQLGVPKEKMRVVLHLYSDMDEDVEKKFWSEVLNVPLENFRKTYRKETKLSGLTYKNGFGHGTCMVSVYDKKLATFILMSLKYLRDTQTSIDLSTSLDSNQDIAKV